jgi:5,5'-dehydrodivanillate O-demethylase
MHRRYWQPFEAACVVDEAQVVPVRLLGEDLVVYRAKNGEYGLVQQRCPHRSALLQDGWVDEEGIRCPYHGWYFNAQGRCLAQPYDDLNGSGTFKDRVEITSYPVQELGGLLWAYLGPLPAPLIPRWETFVEDGSIREIGVTVLPCNWMQIAENTLDPVHVEWLHVNQANQLAIRRGEPPPIEARLHLKVDFVPFEYGIYKRRLMEGDPVDSPDWTVGHPLIFPATLAHRHEFQLRVPIDDTTTLHFHYRTVPVGPEGPTSRAVVKQIPQRPTGKETLLETILQQDFSAWVGQGPVTPRHLEMLGKSDRGIAMFRSMLRQAIEDVQAGVDPIGIIRDPEENEPWVSLHFEGALSPHQARLSAIGGGAKS